MSVEAKLAPQFTSFKPVILAELETQVLFKDVSGEHVSAFRFQTAMVKEQYGLSETAARKVVKQLRPDINQPPLKKNSPAYWQQLSQETGLNFSVNPDFLLTKEPTLESLAGIFSVVYGVEPEKLYPAMEARLAAYKCLEGNVPEVAEIYYKENLANYFTLLKQAIS